MKYNKFRLTESEVGMLQKKIVDEHHMPHTERFGHLEYLSQYYIDGKEYLFHIKSMMGVEVFRLEVKLKGVV